MKAKTTYRSSAMVSDENGKMIRFDIAKARQFVNPENGKAREILVNGQWCSLFVVELTKSTAGIGVQLRNVNIETGETRVVSTTDTTPKAAKKAAAADPNMLFAAANGSDDTDEDTGPEECRI